MGVSMEIHRIYKSLSYIRLCEVFWVFLGVARLWQGHKDMTHDNSDSEKITYITALQFLKWLFQL
jgi:hypothetical protein